MACNEDNIRFGPGCIVGRYATIEVRSAEGRLTVGARALISHYCTISVGSSVRIGEDCLIGEMVSIRDHDHDFSSTDRPIRQQGSSIAPLCIGSNVWLGARVTVTKGVTLGDNVVVGAGAVVTHDIPSNAVALGVPARVVRELPETAQ
jgi:acetyltransferase-like isoleucine patch superfamily enzyme